jgi:hypothetical protein
MIEPKVNVVLQIGGKKPPGYKEPKKPEQESIPSVPPGVVVPLGMQYTRTEMLGGQLQHCFIEDKIASAPSERECETCEGSGKIDQRLGAYAESGVVDCPDCDGDGTWASQEMPITELPDGSGCFTATILSEDEAVALPRAKRPLCYRISSEVYHAIFEAVGYASMCWNPRPGDAVFDSTEAEKCAVNLCLTVAKDFDTLNDRAYRAEAELDKLRKALLKLSKVGTGPCGGGGSLDQYSQGRMEAEKKVRKIARAALKQTN